jgi:hypothetical protein
METLEDRFAHGWNSLPEELKLKILEFNLVKAEPIAKDESGHSVSSLSNLCKHLAMGPEIARLSLEVYYTSNHFVLEAHNGCIQLPPLAARSLIRSIILKVRCGTGPWRIIQSFASGKYGFTRIVYIVMRFSRSWLAPPISRLLIQLRKLPVHFECKGSVELETDPDREHEQYIVLKQRRERTLRKIITFAA